MKILQINSVCGIGSTGRIATDIHDVLIKQGHESYIAYGRDLPEKCDNTIKIGNKFDIYTHVGKTRIFDKHGFGSRNATMKFVQKIKELNPDLIHLHNIHGYYINCEALFEYIKVSKKPVVWSLHDCWSFTGHCAHFDYSQCYRWKTQCFECPEQKNYPASYIFDNSKRNYLKKRNIFTGVKNLNIITDSTWLANQVRNSFLKSYPIKVIYNGIDLEVFKPRKNTFKLKQGISDKFLILGVASNWNSRKGFEYFMELSKVIKEDEIIILVGVSDKQKAILNENMIGITKTNNIEELAEIYSAADVFVNTTLEEVFGLVNIEALACGTPVITFNSGGSPEAIDNKCGFVVEKGDIEQILVTIENLRKQKNIIVPEDGINRVLRLYDKNDRFMDYINLYKELVK